MHTNQHIAIKLSKWTVILCLFLPFLQQCKKTESDMSVYRITLSVDEKSIPADGETEASFTAMAYNAAGSSLPGTQITLYVNGKATQSNTFSTTESGEYSFVAKSGSVSSNEVKLVAEARKPIALSKIVLSSNTYLIIADGQSTAALTLQFFDENQNEITTADYQLYANGTAIDGTDFRTEEAGDHRITATGGGAIAEEIVINARADVQYDIVTIPVIFHIAHFGDPVGTGSNLTEAQIQEMVENTNKTFANELSSTNPNAVDMRVRIRLAQYDEQGNKLAEPGISREDVSRFDDGAYTDTDDIPNNGKLGGNEKIFWERENHWDPSAYLNVWVFHHERAETYANSPFVDENFPLEGLETVAEGCALCDLSMYNIPSVTMHYTDASRSIVLAHEIAHILGVKHPFSIDNCVTGDYCFDTYTWNYFDANQACDNSNKGLLVHDNIMDYKGTTNTFTYDQRERVQHVLKYGFRISALRNSAK